MARIEQRIEDIVQRGVAAAPAAGFGGFECPAAEVKEPEDSAPPGKKPSGSCWGTCRSASRPLRRCTGGAVAGRSRRPRWATSITPTPIDVDTAEHVVLIDAVETRDRYIAYLTQRLRALEMQGPTNWDAMNNAPDELRARLQQLEADYREHLRREECDMALERARLAREQNRLKQDRHKMELQARKLGFTSDEFKLPPAAGEAEGDDRSWRKMFGRKK